MFWARARAATRSLSLGVDNLVVGWYGFRGLKWSEFQAKIQFLLISRPIPRVIVVHLGGNDFETSSVRTVLNRVESGLRYLRSLLPGVTVVWMDIVQRRIWRCGNPVAMEQCRRRVNRAGRQIATGMGGSVISVDIDHLTPGFYRNDGVHLNPVGIEMFLDGIREFLRSLV